MNRYMKKWHFDMPFTWTVDGIVIKAIYHGFLNTIHECPSAADMPKKIKDFRITLWTGEDTAGKQQYHGTVKYEDGEEADLSICGSMLIECASKADGSYVHLRDISEVYEYLFPNKYAVYNFPKLEAVVKNDNIRTTEYLVLSDGWSRLKEENREDYEAITMILKSCENMERVIGTIRSASHLDDCREESEVVLKKALVEKYMGLINLIFKDREIDINAFNNLDYTGSADLISRKFDKYISENY